MIKENALFEDDFEMDFEDDFAEPAAVEEELGLPEAPVEGEGVAGLRSRQWVFQREL